MKILFMEWNSFGKEDMLDAYHQLQYEVTRLPVPPNLERRDADFEKKLTASIQTIKPDYVFSFNYLPLVATVCNQVNTPYISWIYDSPYVMLYSYTVIYPCNRIFLFDRSWCEEFWKNGINTIYYLPLAANPTRLDNMKEDTAFLASKLAPKGEVSFIGSLYTEKHQFYERMTDLSPRARGYLEGIMAAQHQVYGYNFIEQLLNKDILSDLQKALPMQVNYDGVETLEYLYGQYVINRKLTGLERQRYLSEIGRQHPLDLYTHNTDYKLEGALNHGSVDYYDQAPYVFRHSPINLNITLRSILSGIPLRAFDILGAGGFLLTNYQSDFEGLFTVGEDYAYFDSEESLLAQIDYYISHDNIRRDMAQCAHEKIIEQHTYFHRILEMETYL